MQNTDSIPGGHGLILRVDEKSSRHRFIETLDVVLEVCKHLCRSHSKKSLLAFGSTCKALFEPTMDFLWRCLEGIIDLLKVIPGYIEVDRHFVCYSTSGMVFEFAHLIIESRLSRDRFRIVYWPGSTCTLGESEFWMGVVFPERFIWPPLRAHISQVSGVHWFLVYKKFACTTSVNTSGQSSRYSTQQG